MEYKLSPDSESGVRPELENLTVKEINLERQGEEEEDDDEEDDEEASKHINEQRSEGPMCLSGLKSQVARDFVSERQDQMKEKNNGGSKSNSKSTRNKPSRNKANNHRNEDSYQRHIEEDRKCCKKNDLNDDCSYYNRSSLGSANDDLELPKSACNSNKTVNQANYQFEFHHQDLRHYHVSEGFEREDQRHKFFENAKNRGDEPSSLLKGSADSSVLVDRGSLNSSKISHEGSGRSIIQDNNSNTIKGIARVSESDRLDHRFCSDGSATSHTGSNSNVDPIVFCTPHNFGAGYFTVPNAYPAPNVEIKLFVGRVPRNIEEDDLRDLFKLYGRVVNVSVIREKSTGIHRGAALVTMESVAQADFALRELNSIKVLDELRGPLKVQYSTGEPERLGFESESCIPGVDQVKLFVGALPRNIIEDEIRELFSPYGQINEIFIMREPHSGVGKGCAFVKYAFKEQGLFAIKSLHGALTLADVNRPIEVRFASKNHQSSTSSSLIAQGAHLTFGTPAALNFNGHFNFGHHSIQKLHSPRIVGASNNVNNILCNASTLTSSTSPMSQQAPGSSKSSVGIGGTAYQFHNHQSGQHFIGCNSKGLSQSSSHHSLTEQLQIGPFTGVSATGANAVQAGHHPPCGRAITLFDHNGMAVATTTSTAAMFSRSRAVGLPIPASTSATAAAAITANLMPRCIGMWKEYFTSDGKPYYHNELTQVTQWEVPPEFLSFRPNFSREVVGPPGANIFIFNVPYEWDKKSLVGLFCRFGNILSAHLMVDKTSGRNKGVAFVSYDNIHSAAEAVNHMNGFITEQGRKLKVSIKQGQEHFVQHLLKNNLPQGGCSQTGYMENSQNNIQSDSISIAISQNSNDNVNGNNESNTDDNSNNNNDVNVNINNNNSNNSCNNNNHNFSSGPSS
ncbi:RNA binding protein [Cryptosporidium parvum Iowa II]|uniref:RNA binding protein, putative n=2 Tax=Cryptosporidium parvum TaxID=5807 RepID=A3FQM3_CRYPI|nr:RNA binding protein [Cryptosporidium parvum Iowa II]EAZ51266.1 RNA binding protein, putative [Cryptosporidium parvum Iowa II]QOY42094.1 RNA recognition motif/WW domain containing protein [Cryptosporidium parvum]WKS77398.1 putative RNA binding protein [Cryptosporidium sp. 43IA8]WRK31932.1 RNA recognition motif/WW domain containing protein [Cryptosporidium parvum]|eukprot:QOY42094.1 hypothetical protein CPATCC_001698 [Cryptosporidium parvum]